VTERYGTYRFCKAQRLPMRSFKDAMQAVPNYRRQLKDRFWPISAGDATG
jgi:hypothetical protein